jgi:energy-converting hydrogenase A subunit M
MKGDFMTQRMRFDEVLEVADQLSLDEQHELVAILNRRLAMASRQRLMDEVEEARKDFAEGRCVPATPAEIMREILK